MIKIGLIGEDPNDTESIKNLISQKHEGNFAFKQLIKNKKGYQLDNKNVQNALKIEFDNYNPKIVLFIRDADALETEKAKIKKVYDWFLKLNNVVNQRGILLINIYELEALILADIDTFNKIYKTNIKFQGNIAYKKEPKEFLILKTRDNQKKYSESDCPKLFSKLKFDKIVLNSPHFSKFIVELKKVTKIK